MLDTEVSTVPRIVVTVPVPSWISVHVAHNSVYGERRSTVMVHEPFSVMVGAVVSLTMTVLVTLPVLPAWSVYRYVSV